MAQTLGEHVEQVLGGTPAEVVLKMLGGAIVALWGWATATAAVMLAYFALVLVDVVFGIALSQQLNNKLEFRRLFTGPAKKLGLTAALFVGAAVIDTVVPGTFILTGIAGYVCVAQFIDAGDKYHRLTGSKVVEWIKERLGFTQKG